MFEELHEIERHYEELAHRLTMPEAVQDPAAYGKLTREYKELEPLIEAFHRYRDVCRELDEMQQLVQDGSPDAEFKAMLQQEICENARNKTELEGKIRLLLLPKDDNDDKSVILEIRAGAGGEEAALFAHSLWRMYQMYASKCGWRCEIVSLNETELGGVKELILLVEGTGVYSKLKFESGVHRVQRVPETETQGRIHTSTVTVAVMPEAEEVELTIDPKDLRIDTFRASGAGGQHINKTSSAIRVTHLPTGMVVECQDERSQYKNKDKAMKILRSRIYEKMQREQEEKIASERKLQVGAGDRAERIRTYNYPQGRVTDHRIGLTLYKLEQVLNGDLTELFDALNTFDQAEKLKESSGAAGGER